MKTMFLTLAMICFGSWAWAISPDEVRAQYPLLAENVCTDTETGEQGRCYLFQAPDGIYMVFVQFAEPVFMRFVPTGSDGYEEVWRSPEILGVAL